MIKLGITLQTEDEVTGRSGLFSDLKRECYEPTCSSMFNAARPGEKWSTEMR